jgi:putative redox protein
MKKTITGCEIHANGTRKEEHPTGFKKIILEINLKSSDTTADDLNRVIKLSEETYCPVWAMLKGNVEIEIKYNIIS